VETKTNRHATESINQQGATRAVIVSRLRAGLTVKEIMNMKTSKGALFKKKGEVFASEGSADTLLKTKKGTRGTANAYWSTWPQAQRSSSPVTHGKSRKRTSRRCGRRRSGLPARLTATL
jgi:hypothetical protein